MKWSSFVIIGFVVIGLVAFFYVAKALALMLGLLILPVIYTLFKRKVVEQDVESDSGKT